MLSAADESRPLLGNTKIADDDIQQVGEQDLIVDFDSNEDPENPLNWPDKYKWGIVLLLAFMAFTVTFTCIGVVPVANHIVRDLVGKDDKSASVLFVTIWELGEAAGPLAIAPLSEVFGRYRTFNIANICFIICTLLAVLSPDVGLLILARFLTGCAVASNVLNPAIIGDIFPPESRGSGMSAVFLAPLLGGAIGPAIAGQIAESLGWRRILMMALILAVLAEIAFLTLLRETYKVHILRCKAARRREETGDERFRTAFDGADGRPSAALWSSIIRPVSLLFSSLTLQVMSLWGAVIFAFFYVMTVTLPDILASTYGFTPAMIGFAFMTFSVGSVIGLLVCSFLVDRIFVKLRKRHGEHFYPEGRLPLPVTFAFLLPAAVLFYGYSADQKWPVWLLLLANVLVGCTILCAVVPLMTYITDAFGVYSASALTAVLVTRCLAGTFLPLATVPLIQKLGLGSGFLVLAAICLALAPIPALVMHYGPRLRQCRDRTNNNEE